MKCPQCSSDNPDTSRFCGNCAAFLKPEKPDAFTKTLSAQFQAPKEGILFANKYRIVGEIGRGGMGVVLKAEDTKLKRHVALKFLPSELMYSPEARERFIREAQAAAALDHPNICTVYEVEELEDQVYISMAFIDGKTLKETIAREPLKVEKALEVAIQVAEGLDNAHSKGIIHRDIKPANIMLTDRDHVKIMDFGLAKMESAEDITKTSAVMGTVAYMSPEQALGKKIDFHTDIWSFGCLLYEILSGQNPFQGGHEQAVFQAIVHSDPKPITALRDDIPVRLEKILGKCLRKNPKNRYPNTGSLTEELKSVELQDISTSPSLVSQKNTPSIAVLPFVDMSSQKDQEYFCDGIAEELINALTHIQDLRVVARTSAFAFKGEKADIREIGEKLNVKTVLEGSIRKAGNRLRITAQLINIEDGFHLWSERFDRDAEDVFAIQDEISLAIVEALKVTLRVGEKTALKKRSTDNPDAHNFYLKGLYFAARPDIESLNKALKFFKDALKEDPNFALAHSGMARIFGSFAAMNLASPTEMWPKAKEAIHKALTIDEDLVEALAQMAYMAFWSEWDWGSAEKSLERVLALNPGDAFSHGTYAWFMLSQKRFGDAIQEVKKALFLDPLMPLYYVWSVGIHAAAGYCDEAIHEFSKAMELDPKLGLAYFHAGLAYFQKGELEKTTELFKKSMEFGAFPGWAETMLALVYLRKGENEKADRIYQDQLAQIEKMTPSFVSLAWTAAALGDFDSAFEFFDKAYETRDILLPYIHVYTGFILPDLQRDQRFKDLLVKMELVD
jgi:serine/threonine protein kinase/tetratricopeptide (TPR) repeat protein